MPINISFSIIHTSLINIKDFRKFNKTILDKTVNLVDELFEWLCFKLFIYFV